MLPQAVQPALCGSGCGVVLKLSPEGEKPMCRIQGARPGEARRARCITRCITHIYSMYTQ